MKRAMPALGTDNKKPRLGNMESLNADADIAIPPEITLPQGVNAMSNFINSKKTLKRDEVASIEKLLASAYEVAPLAMQRSDIYDLVKESWSEVIYDGDDKSLSLAEILYTEGGWTEATLLKFLGESPTPFVVPPLCELESRVLWASIRYQVGMQELRGIAKFGIILPEEWLGIKLKFKEFGKKGGTDFAKKLAATIEYNQSRFIGKKDYFFRPLCDELGGFVLSENFVKISLVSIFVICCDPALLVSSVKKIKGTWGSSARSKCKTAWTNAVNKAIEEDSVKYPSTLQLFQNLFPNVLK